MSSPKFVKSNAGILKKNVKCIGSESGNVKVLHCLGVGYGTPAGLGQCGV